MGGLLAAVCMIRSGVILRNHIILFAFQMAPPEDFFFLEDISPCFLERSSLNLVTILLEVVRVTDEYKLNWDIIGG